MKRLRFLAMFMAFLMAATPVFAQRPQPDPTTAMKPSSAAPGVTRVQMRPFSKETLAKVDGANALRNGDRKLLNVDPDEFVKRINSLHKLGVDLSDMSKAREQVADFIESLEEDFCEQGIEFTLDAATPNGRIVPNIVHRFATSGERCLRNNNDGSLVVSLMCWNTFSKGHAETNPATVIDEEPIKAPPSLAAQAKDPQRDFGNQNDPAKAAGGPSPHYGWWDPRDTSGKFVVGGLAAIAICFIVGGCKVVENKAEAKVIVNR